MKSGSLHLSSPIGSTTNPPANALSLLPSLAFATAFATELAEKQLSSASAAPTSLPLTALGLMVDYSSQQGGRNRLAELLNNCEYDERK